MKGTIFSIEEFAVFDGEGIRVNVFFKGCPLRCRWCHNPEGLKGKKQIVHSPNGCQHCGRCRRVCPSPEHCIACGACILECPKRLIRFSGEEWEAHDLARRILKLSPVLKASGGGVTFSGGEVLMQPDFLCALLEETAQLNRAVETSGYGKEEDFVRMLERVDFVFFDLKVMDRERHRHYTGVCNDLILENARRLMGSGVRHTFRVPFIHGVNTDRENLVRLRDFVREEEGRPGVEFLPYNKMAGAKYKMLGMAYDYDFRQPTKEDCALAGEILEGCDVRFRKA
ncbi:MAG: glycyl-radical enzyme activating protein [Lachnospiraceae bacterium]|nr:glycyl-radical enzyme activating protein [Lachnospiraceae bacterium]